jgi:hypothetical protein
VPLRGCSALDYFRYCYQYHDDAVVLDDGTVVAGTVRFYWADEFCKIKRSNFVNAFLKPDSGAKIGHLPHPPAFAWVDGSVPAGVPACHCCEDDRPFGVDFGGCWRPCLSVELTFFDGVDIFTQALVLQWSGPPTQQYLVISSTGTLPEDYDVRGVVFDGDGRPSIDVFQSGVHYAFLAVPWLGLPPPFEQDYQEPLDSHDVFPDFRYSSWSVSGIVCP